MGSKGSPSGRVREARLEDLEAMMRIETLSFTPAWSEKALKYELVESKLSRCFIWESEGKVLALAIFRLVLDEAELMQIAVHPDNRQEGIAYRLLRESMMRLSEEGIKRLSLEVRENNLPAQHLYRSLGFEVCGKIAQYYKDSGEDAWIMETSLLDKFSFPYIY